MRRVIPRVGYILYCMTAKVLAAQGTVRGLLAFGVALTVFLVTQTTQDRFAPCIQTCS